MDEQHHPKGQLSLLLTRLSRRGFLGGLLGLGFLGTATTALTESRRDYSGQGEQVGTRSIAPAPYPTHQATTPETPVADLPPPLRVSDPMTFLTAFDYGRVSQLPDGRVRREYTVIALDQEVEVASGVKFPAWTFNGNIPGPTLRCTEGDLVTIHFLNESSMPHTLHFHGFHPANMDGVFEVVPLIIDPPHPRPKAREMVFVMNGFDTDFDNENEFYTVNGVANFFVEHPIEVRQDEPLRIYLANLTEFDLLNSIHTHATFFKFYRTGTRLDQYEYTDTVMLCQGERGIMEYSYKFPGMFMFHAHQSEFAELGWMGFFKVLPAEGKA